jgi:hypothetical protein
MTRPRLYIHIGHPKTGTTSIQTFLLDNREALKKAGILVPHAGVVQGGHHGLTRNWYGVRAREDRSAEMKDALLREIREARLPAAVISSEGFIQENPAELARLFGEAVDVTVIYYIRRQDWVAESVYAQRVRSYIQMAVETPQALLPLLVPRYVKVIARWSDAFGKARMRVRPFEKVAFTGGSLLADFLTLIGVDPALFPEADRRRNTAFKRHYLEFKRLCNLLPLLEHEHQALSDELDRLSAADETPQPRHLFSHGERLRLLENCAAENGAIARDFLGQADGLLFREPPPPEDPGFRPLQAPPADVQHAIFNRLSQPVAETLEFLDRRIRLRLPGEAFLPAVPDDPDELRLLLARRDHNRIRRRLAVLERRLQDLKTARPPAPSGLWARGKRKVRSLLRRLAEKGRHLIGR